MKKKHAVIKRKRSLNGHNGLKPVAIRLGKLEKRTGKVEVKVDRLETKVDKLETRVGRVETELKTFRKETAREFKVVRHDMAKYYFAAREENKVIANEHARTLTKILTTVDAMAKDYSRWLYEKQFSDAELSRHTREINALKEKDAAKENVLQDLQKRVVTLENAKNGRPASAALVSK